MESWREEFQLLLDSFKPFNLTSGGLPSVTISHNGVAFSSSAVDRLNKAAYVEFLIDEGNCQIAIKPCEKDNENAMDFYKEKKTGVRWGNKKIVAMLDSMMKWDKNICYKANGIYYPDEKVIIFNLKSATIYRKHKE